MEHCELGIHEDKEHMMYARTAGSRSLTPHPTSRRLIALDIENINGGSVIDVTDATAAWADVESAIGIGSAEHVVVGVGPSSLLSAGLSRPSARFVMGRGVDGADHALLDVLLGEEIPGRFDEVVIVSGDGIFSDAAAQLAGEGVAVTVVARDGHLSRRLRLAAGSVVVMPERVADLGEAA